MVTGTNSRFHKEHPDGNWTTIVIKMQDDGISGRFNSAGEDPPHAFISADFPYESWQKLVASGKILLGRKCDVPENVGEYINNFIKNWNNSV